MTDTARAELGAVAEAIAGYRRRVGALASTVDDGHHDDLLAAVHEAERTLGIAERTVRRAVRTAGGR